MLARRKLRRLKYFCLFHNYYKAPDYTVAILAQGTSWYVAVTQAFSIFDPVSNAQTLRKLKYRCMFDKHSEASEDTVAILAQGTSRAVAITQASLVFDPVSNDQTLKNPQFP